MSDTAGTDDSDDIYGIEMTEADIEELRETGELKFSYFMSDGDHVEVVIYYDDDGDDDSGSGFRVTSTLR